MIYTGSDGNTAEQIADVIGKDKGDEEIINYYSNFIQRHKGDNIDDQKKSSSVDKKVDWKKSDIPTVNSGGASFKIIAANKLFVAKNLHLLGTFCDTMKEKFDGNLQQVDFKEKMDESVEVGS
uniref:Serpin domain-containing protein n=1 Tax=Panagrolaimus sp. ES5 TaxID=591445 RepID=A0AC34FMH3_9BILA